MKNAFATLLVISILAFPVLADEKSKKTKTVPPLKALDTNGKEVDLAKLKGKVVLIDFWATWCTPCLKEFPRLRKLHDALHKKGFVIIGVANNEKDDLAAFFKKQKIAWPNIADAENTISNDFKVDTWPTAILLDTKGEVIGTNLSASELLGKAIAALKLEPDDYKKLHEELAHKSKSTDKEPESH